MGADPLAGLATLGELPVSLDRVYDELAVLTRWAHDHAPGLKTVVSRGHVWHDGGASVVQQLALTLAGAVQHMRELERRGLDPAQVAPRVRLDLSVSTHFFLEIAALRAARVLWSRIVAACGGDEDAQRATIHARTSRFTKTVFDPHVNILRGTIEAMAAIFGGVDALHVAPFDEPLGLPDRFSRRIARNTHTILREESHFDAVVDPAGGSWCVETLTAQVAEGAWALFQQVEQQGGLLAALRSGWVQEQIGAVADQRRAELARRKAVQVGTNQYANPQEPLPECRGVDHGKLHALRVHQLQKLRAGNPDGRDAALRDRLDGLVVGAQGPDFAAVVEAAAAGATIGELCAGLRHDAAPEEAITPITTWRASEPFEWLRLKVRGHDDAGATTVFCACLGDVARYMPRLDFTRGFFQAGGFTVEAERFFDSPAEAAEAAMETIAGTAVIVGRDDTYAAQAAETARELKDAGVETVLLAGMPQDIADELRTAGVDDFIHVRSDCLAVLTELARSKGVAL
jgi:methylmalonyl-CoA mutase